jgi:hypothetical protein
MSAMFTYGESLPAGCEVCGIPLDAENFDVSSVAEPPGPGETLVLARFDLPPRYCGVLQHFSQFSDQQQRNPEQIVTRGLQWSIRANGRPLSPYLGFDYVLNPWGSDVYSLSIRLDEGVALELVVRGVGPAPDPAEIRLIGGRLAGHYWYNVLHGDRETGALAPAPALRRRGR